MTHLKLQELQKVTYTQQHTNFFWSFRCVIYIYFINGFSFKLICFCLYYKNNNQLSNVWQVTVNVF